MKQGLIAAFLTAAGVLHLQESPPREWVDRNTGHRIVRLTDSAGGSTLYFHDNAFSPEGDKLMINTPAGVAVIDDLPLASRDICGRNRADGANLSTITGAP